MRSIRSELAEENRQVSFWWIEQRRFTEVISLRKVIWDLIAFEEHGHFLVDGSEWNALREQAHAALVWGEA